MPAEAHLALSEGLERSVRMASVPPHVRDVFARLPVALELEAELPADPTTVPLALRQLLKLALLVPKLRVERLDVHDAPGKGGASVRCGQRQYRLGPDELTRGLPELAPRLLEALLEKEHFTGVLGAFAFQSANLEVLQVLTSHMLRSTNVDHALYVMLSGITSGEALGFNRVALFLYDEPRNRFVGSKAIGPFDAEEAHHIWETIEYERKTIEQQIAEILERSFDSRFQQLVQTLELVEDLSPDDEVATARHAQGPLLFLKQREGPANATLSQLRPANEFALAAIQPHDRLLGILFADNLYSGSPISLEQMRFLGFYIDQMALLWENLSLLRQVEKLARHDALTGVLNRRALEALLGEEQRRSREKQSPCSLLLIDVDWFKEINDTRGHQAGDAALRELSELLREVLRPTDTVARFGGDEFVVLLPGCPREGTVAITTRIGQAARERGLSLSVGVASYPSDCAEPSELLATADTNLYAAKRAGRGRACLGKDRMVVF